MQETIHQFVKRIKDCTKWCYCAYWGMWIWSIFISVSIFVVTNQLAQKAFYTNDDENIMYTLAGYYTNGVPQDHPFVNAILAVVLGRLYYLFPTLPWYGIFHLGVLCGCTGVLFKVTLEWGRKSGISFLSSNLFAFLGYCTIIMYPSILLQFTTTSACAGGAAVLLILGTDFKDDIKKIIFEEALAIGFVLLCYMHRKNSGMVVFCFYFCTIFYQWIKYYIAPSQRLKARKYLKSLVICALVTISSIVAIQVVSNCMRSSDIWDSYYKYDEARYKMTDYKHDTYSENPELYEEIDWTEELYDLAGTCWWFFMDKRISANAFQTISQTGYNHMCFEWMDVWKKFLQLFEGNPITTSYLIFVINYFLAYVIVVVQMEKSGVVAIVERIYFSCMMGGAWILCIVLCIKGRFIQRAFHAIIIPYLFISYFLLWKNLSYIRGDSKLKNRSLLTLFLPMAVVLWCVFQIWHTAVLEVESRIEKSKNTIYVEKYVMNHTDHIYIYDVSLTFRYLPFVKYQDQYPSNLIFWGGVGWNSPYFFEQLRINGLTDLYVENLLDKDVYYITKDDYEPDNRSMLLRMRDLMVSEYPECNVRLIEKLVGNINVYKFYIDECDTTE